MIQFVTAHGQQLNSQRRNIHLIQCRKRRILVKRNLAPFRIVVPVHFQLVRVTLLPGKCRQIGKCGIAEELHPARIALRASCPPFAFRVTPKHTPAGSRRSVGRVQFVDSFQPASLALRLCLRWKAFQVSFENLCGFSEQEPL